jgi:hypothetical protein
MTEQYSLVLCHHGVKGMKWGVRRYQRKDGSLIKAKNLSKDGRQKIRDKDNIRISAGQEMYRIAPNKTDKNNTRYMSFRNNDRTFYKGFWGASIRESKPDAKIYEQTYNTTKDLFLPSAKTRRKILSDLAYDPDVAREKLKDHGIDGKEFESNRNIYMKQWSKLMDKKGEKGRAQMISGNIGENPKILAKYGEQVIKRGFNATVDDSGRCIGEMPVILFTAKNTTIHKNSKQVDSFIEEQSRNLYFSKEGEIRRVRKRMAGI